MSIKSRQQGIALISVLLVFSLAAIIASQVASRNYRDIRKTANVLNSKQAYQFSLAGEQLARQLLYRDFIEDKDIRADALTDNWADINQNFDIEEGAMTIEIVDQHSKFNVNSLVAENGQVNIARLGQFRQLLKDLDIDTDYAVSLLDWIDSNSIPFDDGAEDQQYEELNYLTANRFIADRSELRLLRNFSIEDYNRLKEYIVALPVKVNDESVGITKYNLNTLDATILSALLVDSDDQAVTKIVSRQKSGGYDSIDQWVNRGDAKELGDIRGDLVTQSRFFEVIVKAEFAERVSVIRSQLYRDSENGEITMIKRQQGFE